MAVGIGLDIHKLVQGGPLRLGGIDVPHTHRALGHSDGDVVLHALLDAILGAAGRGDIGERFPDQDESNRGRDSREFVRDVWGELSGSFRIENVDVNVLLERPKLGEFKAKIRDSVRGLLGLSDGAVNVKAKSTEGLGDVGRGLAVAAQVVVQVSRR